MVTIEKFVKATTHLSQVERIAHDRMEAGAVSSDVTQDADDWVLTTVLPDPAPDDGDAASKTDLPETPGNELFSREASSSVPPARDGGPNRALDFAQAIVRHWEGCRLTPYHGAADRPGIWTIGWGCIAVDGQPVSAATAPITQARADQLLSSDLRDKQAAVRELITVRVAEYQEAALTSFTYNEGEESLRTSTLRILLNDGQFGQAAAEFMNWVVA